MVFPLPGRMSAMLDVEERGGKGLDSPGTDPLQLKKLPPSFWKTLADIARH